MFMRLKYKLAIALDCLKVFLGLVLVMSLFLGIAVFGAYHIDKHICKQTGIEMQLENKWDFWAGCFVLNGNEQWVKAENYQSVNLEN